MPSALASIAARESLPATRRFHTVSRQQGRFHDRRRSPLAAPVPRRLLAAMWCSTCQHDVSLPEDSGMDLVRCGQCGTTLGYGSKVAAAEESPPLSQPVIPDEDWQLEADIRAVHRLLASLQAGTSEPEHDLPLRVPQVVERQSSTSEPASPVGLAAWTLVSISAAALACGAVLLGWSIAAERPDLWQIGLPLAIGGQAGLLVGLALYLEGLWRSSRVNKDSTIVREVVVHAASPIPSPHGFGESSLTSPWPQPGAVPWARQTARPGQRVPAQPGP